MGYGRVDEVELNPRWGKYRGVIVAGPREKGLPEVEILDLGCGGDARKVAGRYRIALQTILMVDCKGRNAWPVRPRKWSAVVFAVDRQGRALWIHSRSPYEPHAFIDHLMSLPLSIARMAYLEGGPEASLFVDLAGQKVERVGSFETDFNENDLNAHFWDLPNVFGIKPRAPAAK